ncbi:hypothetical protein [Arthrobacter sp. A2-55]|uniref:hypothetical protein n=1 Tax=Arthrobacter sp. A2-55 TaxID=2897337 RepID=UPI0021CD75F6|nr:hypothetical protein [Arthrobacter sp. A2-55]MCU6479013.1 hypothetical protein [Arthrobacter sp. A2-55]
MTSATLTRRTTASVDFKSSAAHAQEQFFILATNPLLPTDVRVQAARDAVSKSEDAFDEAEMDEADIRLLLADDQLVLQAATDLQGVEPESHQFFGAFLVGQLAENFHAAEALAWSEIYHRERVAYATSDAWDAYEIDDPKHPDYLERLGL